MKVDPGLSARHCLTIWSGPGEVGCRCLCGWSERHEFQPSNRTATNDEADEIVAVAKTHLLAMKQAFENGAER